MSPRERAVAGLSWLFTRLAIAVAPKPEVPDKRRFRVTCGTGLQAYLLFSPSRHTPRTEWHVATILQHVGEKPLVVDAAVGRCWVGHLQSNAHVDRCFRAFRAEYVVEIQTDPQGLMVHSSIGPVTCVTLAKRLIGVHNPGIVTSRQLLALLWELHDGH